MVKSLLKPEIKRLFDKAAASELYASHLYQFVANNYQRLGFFGAQKFFLGESKEELEHYQKLSDFVNDMGDMLGVPEVEKISVSVKTLMDGLIVAYKIENTLLNQYVQFYEQAEEQFDCVTSTYLIEFIQIQRKAVGQYGDLISKLERNPDDVFEFDEYLGTL